jgi:hypothetical protein
MIGENKGIWFTVKQKDPRELLAWSVKDLWKVNKISKSKLGEIKD